MEKRVRYYNPRTGESGELILLELPGALGEFTNDAGFVDAAGAAAAAPVQSVNGQTGAVDTFCFGDCTTAAGTAAKLVSIPGITSYADGLCIHVRFSNRNTASSPTLNVNGLGAKPIHRYGTTVAPTYFWAAGEVVELVYYSGAWKVTKGGAATTTYYGLTKLSDSTSSTSTSLAATANAVKTVMDAIPTNVSQLNNDAGYLTTAVESVDGGTGAVDTWVQRNITGITDPADDTVENWAALGTGWVFYNTADCLIGQPNQWGFLLNFVSGTDVWQIFKAQSTGGIYYRSGNQSTVWVAADWKQIATV